MSWWFEKDTCCLNNRTVVCSKKLFRLLCFRTRIRDGSCRVFVVVGDGVVSDGVPVRRTERRNGERKGV